MVRKLSLMLVLTLGLVPFAAQALGLGDIKLNSALNQEFDAEISLLSLGKGEIYDVKVSMASDEAFKMAGVDRTFLLTTLRFKTEQKEDGTAIIKVTSKDPIREPFLNFLIEVNWPKGRLVREYTVLLDPPVTLKRKPVPIQAPKVTKKPSAPVKSTPVIESTPEPAPIVAEPYVGGADEVKVENNQSLWVIARDNKREGVDHTRMMMAIYHANQQAFYGNINKLKRGSILRIPKKDEALKLGVGAAQREYKQQVESWQAELQGASIVKEEVAAEAEQKSEEVVETKAEEPADAKSESEAAEVEGTAAEQKQTSEAKPEAEAPQEAKAAEEKPVEQPAAEEKPAEEKVAEEKPAPDGELKIATARPEGKGEAGPSEDGQSEETVARLKQQLLLMEENAESVRSENAELSSRVEDLEDQLKDLERILELKNKQFAELQAALAKSKKEQILLEEGQKQQEAEAAVAPEAAVAAEPVAKPEEAKPEVEAVKEEKAPAAEGQKVEAKPEAVAEKVEPKAAAEVAEPAKPVAQEKQDSVVKPLSKPEKPAVKVAKQEPEPGLLDAILSSPTLLGLTFIVIFVLIAVVWMLLSRNKRTNTTDFQESILLNTLDDEAESSLVGADNIPTHTEETSFLSDFSPSDIDALQDETGEVDPLSEADVYIAYGRYQQAEELISQAIEKEPERDALKHKMFEILYALKDKDGFVKLVEQSSGTTVETGDSEAWQKVLSMGKMLVPEHPGFAGAEEMESEDSLFSLDDDLLDDDLGESDLADLDESLTKTGFDTGLEPEVSAEADESDDLLDISNDLDDTGVGLDDLDFESNIDDDFINAALDELDGLDKTLDTEAGKDEQIKSEPEVSDENDDEDEFTLTLSDLEDEGEKTILSLQDELAVDDSEDDESLLDLNAMAADALSEDDEVLANELEDTLLDLPESDSELVDSEMFDLGDLDVDLSISDDAPDEVSTKLDLAQAYIEMGDKEGAADILDEVLAEGNDAQKAEAQKIKDSIG